MTQKLIMRITTIPIGLKITIVIIVGWIFFNSCRIIGVDEDPDYDYCYKMTILNTTNDTLIIMLNDSTLQSWGYKLTPGDTIDLEHNISFNEGTDLKNELFSFTEDKRYKGVCLFINDSTLLVKWDKSSFEESNNKHHFFNYNSWKSWLEDDNEGIVMFTIYESDLEN